MKLRAYRILGLSVALSLSACIKPSTQPDASVAPVASNTGAREVYEQPKYVENVVSGWNIRCAKDRGDQSRYCNAVKDDLSIGMLYKTDNSLQYRVVVGAGSVYPDSGQVVRIDSDTPLESGPKGFTSEQSQYLIQRLQSAAQISTRYRQWPSGSYVQKVTATPQFTQVLNFMTQSINAL
jgi:hypothetical protein